MKLNQFAIYRVNQQTEGKVLWHLPYQEAIRQNVPIRIESYRLISIQPMQEEEKVSDIWKTQLKQSIPLIAPKGKMHVDNVNIMPSSGDLAIADDLNNIDDLIGNFDLEELGLDEL